MFKCSLTYTPTMTVYDKTRCRLATSPQSRLNVLVGLVPTAAMTESPFALLRRYRSRRNVHRSLGQRYPALIATAHPCASPAASATPLLIALGTSLCRLPRAPAADRTFPTLSLQIVFHMPGPLPRRLPWCSYPFLPTERRPSRHYNPVGAPHHPYSNFRTGHFSRLQSFDDLQACRFARHPGCSHRSASHWAAVAFTSPPISVRYLSEQGIG
jgi:hypothetical protein